jgi:ABC-type phosphate transport system substrate-binding protein
MIFGRMIKYSNPFLVIVYLLIALVSCKSFKEKEDELPDNKNKGTLNVSADESFKPVIDAQVQVYEANHRGTKIRVQYKPEAECLKDLGVDSIRMIIATRSYNEDEKSFMVDSMGVSPENMIVARDAIAVIVNPGAPYTGFTMKDIVEILKGTFTKNLIPVFDGVKATSTVRFIIDSVLRGDSLTSKAVAARSSEEVVDYVSKNQDVVGFIGVSWIGNPEDTAQLGFLKKVKMLAIESTQTPGMYVKPSQANIYIKRYPMVRDLVYILKEKYKGLGHGFADFMSGEIGQLIFRRAYLMPAQKNFGIRPVKLNE